MPPIQIKLDSKQLQLTVEGVNKLGKAAKQAVMDEIGATAVDVLGKSVEKMYSCRAFVPSVLVKIIDIDLFAYYIFKITVVFTITSFIRLIIFFNF